MSVTSLSSFEQEEDELFEDIDNEDDKKIEEFLKTKEKYGNIKTKIMMILLFYILQYIKNCIKL